MILVVSFLLLANPAANHGFIGLLQHLVEEVKFLYV